MRLPHIFTEASVMQLVPPFPWAIRNSSLRRSGPTPLRARGIQPFDGAYSVSWQSPQHVVPEAESDDDAQECV